jgi:hypothetical protein
LTSVLILHLMWRIHHDARQFFLACKSWHDCPPPKPNVFGQSSPNKSVKAGAASTPMAASSNDLQFVLCPIVGTGSEYQKAMDAGSRASLAEIQCLRDSAWEAIGTATVDGSKRLCYWKACKRTAGSITMPPVKSRRHTSSRTDSSPLLSPCGKASTVTEVKSKFKQCQKRSDLSPKSSFWMDIPTHDAPRQPSMPLTS